MNIKSLTLVGNECEIIESFVRYNLNILGEMVFVLNFGSVDQTVTILKKLQQEGLNIRIYDEPLVAYEQKTIENKYLRLLAENNDVDLIIPLDADEFIAAEDNPRRILDSFRLDKVYTLKWINYIMTESDDLDEPFIPRRITHCDPEANTYDKVIIPAQLVREKNIIVTTGHHDVIGKVEKERINELYIAHYPLISWEQYKSKVYCSSINFINWNSREEGEGSHINKLVADLEQGGKLGLTIYNKSKTEKIIYKPIKLDFIEKNKLELKYTEYSHVNLTQNLIRTAQNIAMKVYRYEIEEQFVNKDRTKVLVYGTGEKAKSLFNGIQENLVNVVCYIDSNPEKKFTRFKKRLVISPEFIRMFEYNKIIISSQKYFDEMKQTLLKIGIPEDRIVGEEYLLDLQIRNISKKN